MSGNRLPKDHPFRKQVSFPFNKALPPVQSKDKPSLEVFRREDPTIVQTILHRAARNDRSASFPYMLGYAEDQELAS